MNANVGGIGGTDFDRLAEGRNMKNDPKKTTPATEQNCRVPKWFQGKGQQQYCNGRRRSRRAGSIINFCSFQ